VRALTGPVARGDAAVVERQIEELQRRDPQIADVYCALNRIALELAREQGTTTQELLDTVALVLSRHR
jgi:predicted short-subunit dehydrogenase-like oxidoreductase (DUF2520 family)